MYYIKWRFTWHKYEQAVLFNNYIGGSVDQVSGNAIGDGAERAHAARNNHHGVT